MHNPADRISHTTAFVTPVVEHWLECLPRGINPKTHCNMCECSTTGLWLAPLYSPRCNQFYDTQLGSERSSDLFVMVDPLSYFSFQPVIHDWCNKVCGMCYHVCGMVQNKDTSLLIRKGSPCRFHLLLSEWSFII